MFKCLKISVLHDFDLVKVSPAKQLHSDRFLIELFQNHGLKGWISLKIMLLWLWKVIMSLFNHEK